MSELRTDSGHKRKYFDASFRENPCPKLLPSHMIANNIKKILGCKMLTCESLFPRSIIEAALEAAFSCPSTCKAIPTSARAREGASLIPSPTFWRLSSVGYLKVTTKKEHFIVDNNYNYSITIHHGNTVA